MATISKIIQRNMTALRAREVEVSELVDVEWYFNRYPDVRASKMDPRYHYLRYGGFEGRDPHPLFSTSFYATRYPAVTSSGMNPLVHYLRIGAASGYDPHPIFSSIYVATRLGTCKNPLISFLESSRNGALVSPHPLFDSEWYARRYGAEIPNGMDPLIHFIYFGARLGFDPHLLFSTSYYRARYSDIGPEVNPLSHFIAQGALEGRDPHPAFDTNWYRARYMGGLPATDNPLVHFISVGSLVDAVPHVLFPTEQYRREMGESMPKDAHPLMYALQQKHLKFEVPKLTVDEETTISKRRAEVAIYHQIDAFLTFNVDAISGGIFSIFSIVEELRRLGRETVLFSLPGGDPIVRYKRFNNHEIILPFGDLISAIRLKRIQTIHVPEVVLPIFINHLRDVLGNPELRDIKLNILNQNGELMPEKHVYQRFVHQFREATMTTAHERYSTSLHAERWGVPIKHISTYMSFDDYKIRNFTSKKNIILLSPDRMIGDEVVLDQLQSSFGGYYVYRVAALHYEFYKFCIGWCKFCITFGEGLDNYFIETTFTGGIAFAVYNPVFMPSSMKALPNVFGNLIEMKEKLPSLMRDLELDEKYREEVFLMNFSLLKKLYDKSIYRQKLKDFSLGRFDWAPGAAQ
ncbi:hypothetical protein ACQZ6F_16655 [Rhizobium sp. A22-96]